MENTMPETTIDSGEIKREENPHENRRFSDFEVLDYKLVPNLKILCHEKGITNDDLKLIFKVLK